MFDDLSEVALWAAVLSPFVTAGVFAGSLVYDRWKRKKSRREMALARARSALLSAANWTTLPYPFFGLGGWSFRVLDAMTTLVTTIPVRRYLDLSTWLISGASLLAQEPTVAKRIEIQQMLFVALFEQEVVGRRALQRAQKYARSHPWPKPTPKPRFWRAMASVGGVAIQAVSGDRTYSAARPPSHGR